MAASPCRAVPAAGPTVRQSAPHRAAPAGRRGRRGRTGAACSAPASKGQCQPVARPVPAPARPPPAQRPAAAPPLPPPLAAPLGQQRPRARVQPVGRTPAQAPGPAPPVHGPPTDRGGTVSAPTTAQTRNQCTSAGTNPATESRLHYLRIDSNHFPSILSISGTR